MLTSPKFKVRNVVSGLQIEALKEKGRFRGPFCWFRRRCDQPAVVPPAALRVRVVARRRGPDEARAFDRHLLARGLVLTDAGRRTLEEAAPGHVREVRRLVVDVLSPEQFAALGAAA